LNWTTSTSLMIGDSSLRASLGIDFLDRNSRSAAASASCASRKASAVHRSCRISVGRRQSRLMRSAVSWHPRRHHSWAVCSSPSFGIAKFAAARFAWRYQQKYQQGGPLQRTFAWILKPSRQFSGEIRNRTSVLSSCYYYIFFRGAPGRQPPKAITV